MVAKISFALVYNVMLCLRLSSLRHKLIMLINAYVVVRTRLKKLFESIAEDEDHKLSHLLSKSMNIH